MLRLIAHKLSSWTACALGAANRSGQTSETLSAHSRKTATSTLRAQGGFTLTEVLATVIVVGLVSVMMAGGIMLANKHFASSMARSQAQQLYTTLAQTLDIDLRYAGNTDSDYGEEDDGSVHFKSRKHGAEIDDANYLYLRTLDDEGKVQTMDTYGQLALCTKNEETKIRLLGKGAYNNGLVVKIDSLKYSKEIDCFVIKMSVARSSDTANPIIDAKEFTIKALNKSGDSESSSGNG